MYFRPMFLGIAILGASVPSMSQALSCRPADAERKIERMFEAGLKPLVIVGFPVEIERTPPTGSALDLKTRHDRRATREPEPASYQILGTILGTDRTETVEVVITKHCVGEWCGLLPSAYEARTFILYEKDGTLQGHAGPCGGSQYPLPTREQRAALTQCLSEKKCDSADRPLESLARPDH